MKITNKELRYHVENNDIQNIYLFSGPETGEKKEIIEIIEKKIFKTETPAVYSFYCDDNLNNADLMNTLNTGLLFSDKKIVILKSIEDISSKTIKLLERYLIPSVFDSTEFEKSILDKTDEKSHKSIKGFYKKENNSYLLTADLKKKIESKILEIFKKAGYVSNKDTYLIMINETIDKIPDDLTDLLLPEQNIIFWEMFESQKIEWIKSEFKKNNLYINNDAIDFILDMIPNYKDQLKDEITKIVNLYADKGNKKKNLIELSFIEDYLGYAKEETAFNLYSIILEGDLEKALVLMSNIFYNDDMGLLNGIAWAHRRFLKALDLYENQNMPINAVFNNLKIISKRNQEEMIKGFKNYNFYHAAMMFYYLGDLDYSLKILPEKLKLIKLQEFIIKFITKKGHSRVFSGEPELLEK